MPLITNLSITNNKTSFFIILDRYSELSGLLAKNDVDLLWSLENNSSPGKLVLIPRPYYCRKEPLKPTQ